MRLVSAVRLAGGANAGRLEVNYYGVWGTVCLTGFDNNDAQVACFMLGFRSFCVLVYTAI